MLSKCIQLFNIFSQFIEANFEFNSIILQHISQFNLIISNEINRIYITQFEINYDKNNEINEIYKKILDELFKIKYKQTFKEQSYFFDINTKIRLWEKFNQNEKDNSKYYQKIFNIVFQRSFNLICSSDLLKSMKLNKTLKYFTHDNITQTYIKNNSSYIFLIGIEDLNKKYFIIKKNKLNSSLLYHNFYVLDDNLNIIINLLE